MAVMILITIAIWALVAVNTPSLLSSSLLEKTSEQDRPVESEVALIQQLVAEADHLEP
jgi:hypothetical protein